jgi:hypothetical protein
MRLLNGGGNDLLSFLLSLGAVIQVFSSCKPKALWLSTGLSSEPYWVSLEDYPEA